MISHSVEKEYQGMLDAYRQAGGDSSVLQTGNVAKLVVHENKVLSASEVDGVSLIAEPRENGISAKLLVEAGVKVSSPIHLCFGILPEEGLQDISMLVDVGNGAEVSVIAHCVFPNAIKVIHKMNAVINVGNSASFSYKETHYHGDFGGIEVIPRVKVTLGEKAVYHNTFSLVEGCVGKLDLDYDVISGVKSLAELTAKVYGKSHDIIKISEKVHLNGEAARSLIKTRIVLRDKAQAEIIGETHGNAPYARGHVDCTELLNGREATARAIPIVSVTDDRAKVTHEAAIGSIDSRQLETLMARGLEESEAIDVIVRGILR